MFANLVIKDLPSHFKPYEKPFKVEVSPFKVRDVETLASMTDPVQKIEYLLEGIKLKRSSGVLVDARTLTSMDFYYIGVNRMIVSGFDEMKLVVSCPQGHSHSYIARMSQLDFDELDVDIPIYLGLSKISSTVRELVLMPDTVGRLIEANSVGLFGDDLDPLSLLALVIYKYKDFDGNYVDLSVKQAVDLLKELPAVVLGPLDELATKLAARLKPLSLTCKTCGTSFEAYPSANLLDVITPFRQPEGASGIEIRFGDE